MGHFIRHTFDDTMCRRAYLAKCFLSLIVALGSFVWGCVLLGKTETFAFQFGCHLDDKEYKDTLRLFDYYCADKSITLAKIIQILFLFVCVLIILASIRYEN